MIATCPRCGNAFDTSQEDACAPPVLCPTCYRAEHNPPGLSPIYAVARQMIDAVAPGDSPSMASVGGYVGTLHASITRYGNDWALTLVDVQRTHPDTLATWAAAVGQDAAGWLIDQAAGGRVARLAWQGAGEAMPEGGRVTWIGGAP